MKDIIIIGTNDFCLQEKLPSENDLMFKESLRKWISPKVIKIATSWQKKAWKNLLHKE